MSSVDSETLDTAETISRLESDDWDVIPVQQGSPELSVEAALLWCLTPAIHGIKSIGVLSATERARKLIAASNGDTTGAVVLAAGGESGGSRRSKIIFEFLLRQVPFVGCPAYILTSTWTHLRAVATIAAIYGHDLEQARTQHEILWCLLPSQPESGSLPSPPVVDAGPVATTAKTVSNVLISSALKKTIGVSMVTEVFQLGTDLWAASARKSCEDEDGFELLSLGPASTARHYFCPESQFSSQTFALTAAAVLIPMLFRLPMVITSLLVITALLVAFNFRLLIAKAPQSVLNEGPRAVSYVIFGVHAILPILGISSGISIFLSSLLSPVSMAERVSLLVLSSIALSGGLRGANVWAEAMEAVHVEMRKVAIIIGVIFHILPFFDRSLEYTKRIAWLLSDTELCSSSRSLHFLSIIVSSSAQQLLVAQLKRRDVILRLLGAERVMILSLTLFFRGVTAAVTTESLLPLFRQITPHPYFCCLVMTLRRFPVHAAALLTLVPLVPVWIASPGLSMALGLLTGTLLVATTWRDWKANEHAYLSHMRLLYILPGAALGKTRQVIDSMLTAGGRTAIKSVLADLAKRLSNKLFKSP